MPVTITWNEIALRLALTVLAGVVIGFNRGEHGRPAGMRTTLLVCLAASLSMLQANLLMNSVGKTHDSFVVLDLMRLPLGVLSGMGFIGAGAIVRKGNLVHRRHHRRHALVCYVGRSLCFGGGLLAMGLAALTLGVATFWGLNICRDVSCTGTSEEASRWSSDREVPTDEEIRKTMNWRCKICIVGRRISKRAATPGNPLRD